MLDDQQIVAVFNDCFRATFAVELSGGASEPLYTPAADGQPAKLAYRENFAASALHEAAHWCLAGETRRQQVDLGLDYIPPPRSPSQQLAFQHAEERTQALESVFAEAAGVKFTVSTDNLDWSDAEFEDRVLARRKDLRSWMQSPAGERAAIFYKALRDACDDR